MTALDQMRDEDGRGNDGAVARWAEAISLFQSAYRGDQLAGRVVLDTTDELRPLTEMLLQLLEVHLLDADDASMSRFLSSAAHAGPPPRYGYRPMPHPRPRAAS